jgi:hypothetical protein
MRGKSRCASCKNSKVVRMVCHACAGFGVSFCRTCNGLGRASLARRVRGEGPHGGEDDVFDGARDFLARVRKLLKREREIEQKVRELEAEIALLNRQFEREGNVPGPKPGTMRCRSCRGKGCVPCNRRGFVSVEKGSQVGEGFERLEVRLALVEEARGERDGIRAAKAGLVDEKPALSETTQGTELKR